ncbi:MAG: hypothetical protein QOF70_7676 [Acetobacteraceae bacterium]|jgi:hypothetical protein|nr:hypothetical protein [Acetobacteraceae bacterium]
MITEASLGVARAPAAIDDQALDQLFAPPALTMAGSTVKCPAGSPSRRLRASRERECG